MGSEVNVSAHGVKGSGAAHVDVGFVVGLKHADEIGTFCLWAQQCKALDRLQGSAGLTFIPADFQ